MMKKNLLFLGAAVLLGGIAIGSFLLGQLPSGVSGVVLTLAQVVAWGGAGGLLLYVLVIAPRRNQQP